MKSTWTSFWMYTFCFMCFGFFAWHEFKFAAPTSGNTELASKGSFETAEQCGPERNYLLKDLKNLSTVYAGTRSTAQIGNNPPRECVSYIMQNFLPLGTKTDKMAQCRDEKGKQLDVPARGANPPCVTETYVNSVYNSIVDVGDCLNIPVKELLPKLYNESGLHVSTLGGGFDAGVGQLTVSALREVFMRYDAQPENPTALDWYIREIKKSSKASCKRIIAEQSAYAVEVPTGQKLCIFKEASDTNCYTPWASDKRCVVMTVPSSPLRNVLFTGVFYRSMLKNATGLSYAAGSDTINGRIYKDGEGYNGYIGNGKLVDRLRNLGVTHANQEVVRQILVTLGFNAGIRSGKIYLENYLKQREAKNKFLKDQDVDFQNTNTGKWAIVTNMPTFWRGLRSEDKAEFDKAMASLEALKELGLDVAIAQTKYKEIRPYARKEVVAAEALPEPARTKKTNELMVKYDKYRHPILKAVFEKSDELTLPEYMRIAHSYSIITDKDSGGAPGYLSFVAGMHKKLETEMGARLCTADQYLQF